MLVKPSDTSRKLFSHLISGKQITFCQGTHTTNDTAHTWGKWQVCPAQVVKTGFTELTFFVQKIQVTETEVCSLITSNKDSERCWLQKDAVFIYLFIYLFIYFNTKMWVIGTEKLVLRADRVSYKLNLQSCSRNGKGRGIT